MSTSTAWLHPLMYFYLDRIGDMVDREIGTDQSTHKIIAVIDNACHLFFLLSNVSTGLDCIYIEPFGRTFPNLLEGENDSFRQPEAAISPLTVRLETLRRLGSVLARMFTHNVQTHTIITKHFENLQRTTLRMEADTKHEEILSQTKQKEISSQAKQKEISLPANTFVKSLTKPNTGGQITYSKPNVGKTLEPTMIPKPPSDLQNSGAPRSMTVYK